MGPGTQEAARLLAGHLSVQAFQTGPQTPQWAPSWAGSLRGTKARPWPPDKHQFSVLTGIGLSNFGKFGELTCLVERCHNPKDCLLIPPQTPAPAPNTDHPGPGGKRGKHGSIQPQGRVAPSTAQGQTCAQPLETEGENKRKTHSFSLHALGLPLGLLITAALRLPSGEPHRRGP